MGNGEWVKGRESALWLTAGLRPAVLSEVFVAVASFLGWPCAFMWSR
jgi:hypothetical protein